MDLTVMHINKGNALSWGNPKGTHTERKGNAVTRLNSADLLLLTWDTIDDWYINNLSKNQKSLPFFIPEVFAEVCHRNLQSFKTKGSRQQKANRYF